ncbi:hypothetical protein MF271_14075 [Deinococcus sp. KNUC1210]|uniref:delta-60 repeat domain-containing protein n=1 Tax=Deinococcus sp. KNUC1210 TaxID=2917691 RepID=UPI001EF0458E|nr:delta-60 repeat domain-containing protein [Deinococcus sp. KNUC1210]ULH15074.1 hypothetical protein MF271_14075 [Deinococcus sp. KNUC1210]
MTHAALPQTARLALCALTLTAALSAAPTSAQAQRSALPAPVLTPAAIGAPAALPDLAPIGNFEQLTAAAAGARLGTAASDQEAQRGCAGNLIQNPDISSFSIGSSTNFPPSTVPGWVPAVYTPQVSPSVGWGSAPGWLLAWGYQDGGESFAQNVNLPAGTYTLRLMVRAFNATTASYARSRISFRNGATNNPWNAPSPLNLDSGNVAAPGGWMPQSYTFTLTAPASTMQVTTLNNNPAARVNGHPELVSWMGYDSFCLQRVQPVALHHALSVRTLPNGNTVMVGSADAASSTPGSDPDFATVMYDPSGNVLWSRTEHLSARTDEARDVAIDAQGNVVVVGVRGVTPGAVYEDTAAVLYRYDGATGAVLGSLIVDAPGRQDLFSSVEIDAQNRIVTGGTDGTQTVPAAGGTGNWRSFRVRRYLPTLTPDPSFGSAGVATTSINPHFGLTDYASTLQDVAIQRDGKILAAGTSRITELGNVNVSVMLRLNPNGTLDSSYGVGGVQTVGLGAGTVIGSGNPAALSGAVSSQFSRIQLQGEQAVMAGFVLTGAPNDLCSVTRLNASGQLDASFGAGGVSFLKQSRCLGIASDGKTLAVTGTDFSSSANAEDVLYAALNGATGSVLTRSGTHNPNGYAAGSRFETGTNLAFQPASGRYVLSGYTNRGGPDDEWFAPLLLK